MKLNHLTDDTFESNASETKGMSVAVSAKMESMYFDTIYANKPWSITKEVWQNALDAHIEAGKAETPFDVVYPSLFQNQFKVRDYANSMSHEFMMDKYTVVGFSTKDNTNEFNGAWGLGRLSPLGYADSFTVTTYRKGLMRLYTITKAPLKVTSMGDPVSTNEPDGTEVSFVINKQDVDAFKKAAELVSLGFDTKPKVINQDMEWPSLPVVLSVESFHVIDSTKIPYEHPMRHSSYVKMGCVVYPLNNAPSETIDDGLRRGILFNCPIGSLSVTASRESLSYDERTLQKLREVQDRVYEEYTARFEMELARCENLWEANEKYRAQPYSLSKLIKNAQWEGISLPVEYKPTKSFVDLKGFERWSNGLKLIGRNYIGLGEKPDLVIVNKTKGEKDVRVLQRLKKAYENKNLTDKIIYFEFDQSNKECLREFIYLTDTWGFEPKLLSSMEDPGPSKSTSKKSYVKMYSGNRLKDYTLSEEEFDEGGLFIPSRRSEPEVRLPGVYSWFDWAKVKLSLDSILKDKSPKIFVGVPVPQQKKFTEAPQWKNLKDYTESVLSCQTFLQMAKKGKYYALRHNCYSSYDNRHIRELLGLGRPVCNDPVTLEVYNLFLKLGLEVTCPTPPEVKEVEKVFEKYPLFKYYRGSDKHLFDEYKKLIDKQKGN